MTERLFEWFLDRQLIIALALGGVSLLTISLLASHSGQAIVTFLFSFLLIIAGNWLYTTETAENWLNFSYSETLKTIVGGVLLLIGWVIILRRLMVFAIALVISKISQ